MTDHSNFRSKLLDDIELRKLETEARLEPNIEPRHGESYAQTSSAISDKRIADALDRIADFLERADSAISFKDREAGVWLYMLTVLTKRFGSYEAVKMLEDYFERSGRGYKYKG